MWARPKGVYKYQPTIFMSVSFVRIPGVTEDQILAANTFHDDEEAKKQKVVAVMVERAPTAAASLQGFFSTVQGLQKVYREQKKDEEEAKPTFVTIAAVGLRLGGRSGRYNLYWFPLTDKIFAVAEDDKASVYGL